MGLIPNTNKNDKSLRNLSNILSSSAAARQAYFFAADLADMPIPGKFVIRTRRLGGEKIEGVDNIHSAGSD
ncbi:hypothetical protein YSY43_36170 [Paenibacillus sp. YSY-4.3]